MPIEVLADVRQVLFRIIAENEVNKMTQSIFQTV
jgi:hypothetical protein